MKQDNHEELARKLSAIGAPPPPEGLLDKLRDDIPGEFPVVNRSRVRQFTGWSLGLAASIVMMIGAAYFAVSYQKSESYDMSAPESQRTIALAPKRAAEAVPVSGALQPTPAEAKAYETTVPRAQATPAQQEDLHKDKPAAKRDQPLEVGAAKQQAQTFAPEAPPPAATAELRQDSGAEGGLEQPAVADADVSSERSNVARNEAADEVQRSTAKVAQAAPAPAAAAGAAPMQTRMKSEAVAPVRVGGDIPKPRVTRKIDPVLSGEAKRANVRGIVVVDVTIDRYGNVIATKLLKGLPYGIDDAVMDAVRRWKFEPTVIDGRAVTVVYEVGVKIDE